MGKGRYCFSPATNACLNAFATDECWNNNYCINNHDDVIESKFITHERLISYSCSQYGRIRIYLYMRLRWNCSLCKYATERKWNLERHYEKIHGQMKTAPQDNILNNFMFNPNRSGFNASQRRNRSFEWKPLENLRQMAELNNITANSRQTFERLDFLQRRANYFENELRVLYQNCWIIPKQHVLGLSGFVCANCKSFSLKQILDPGYDRTMQSRHRCREPDEKRSYFIYQITPDIQNIDVWAGRALRDQLDYHTCIGKYLYSVDTTKTFNECGYATNPQNACDIMGIPDRYYLRRLDEGLNIGWVKNASENLGRKIPMYESDVLDFLTRVKSTYAILEIPTGGSFRQIIVTLTN